MGLGAMGTGDARGSSTVLCEAEDKKPGTDVNADRNGMASSVWGLASCAPAHGFFNVVLRMIHGSLGCKSIGVVWLPNRSPYIQTSKVPARRLHRRDKWQVMPNMVKHGAKHGLSRWRGCRAAIWGQRG